MSHSPTSQTGHHDDTDKAGSLARNAAKAVGAVFLLVGILGFVPGINQMDHTHGAHNDLTLGGPGHGMLLGLFHVNVLHNLVHILFGVWGLLVFKNTPNSINYARGVAIIYFVLAVAGLIPRLNTMFGLVPLEGNDVWLHFLLAAPAAYFGFLAPMVNDDAMMTDTTNSAGTSR
jgi:hypothetical protein